MIVIAFALLKRGQQMVDAVAENRKPRAVTVDADYVAASG